MNLNSMVAVAWRSTLIVALLVCGTASDATAGLFIRLDGISGSSDDKDYTDFNPAFAYSTAFAAFGESVVFESFTVSRDVDAASVPIWNQLLTGRPISEVEVHYTGSSNRGEFPVATWELENVHVLNYATSGGPFSTPTESFSLDFDSAKYTYFPRDESGAPTGAPIEATWNDSRKKFAFEGNVDELRWVFHAQDVPEPACGLLSLVSIGLFALTLVRR